VAFSPLVLQDPSHVADPSSSRLRRPEQRRGATSARQAVPTVIYSRVVLLEVS
jgi:hypothetical protein